MYLAESRSTTYSFEEGILCSVLKPIDKMSLMDAAENTAVRNKIKLAYPVPVLLDIRNLKDMTLDAILATGNQKDPSIYSAVALLVSKTVHEIIARESKRFKKNAIPYRIFQSENLAKAWLKEFV